jgi:FkbM family methyltransferase
MWLTRVRDGLGWRYRLAVREASRRRYLRKNFVNAEELLRSLSTKVACDRAICRDGLVIQHPPGRTALVQMLLEVWLEQVYTKDFYVPAAGDVVVDAGANIGLFSLLIARMCPACRVLAFEPFEENYRVLSANLAAARATGVTPTLGAVSGASGFAGMVDVGVRSQDHRLGPSSDSAVSGPAVRTFALSEILEMAGTATIALFKCDIEGSEHDVFAEATPDLLGHFERFAIEYHDNLRPGTLQLLRHRLGPSHEVRVVPDGDYGYGMLYAVRRASRP